MKIKSRTIDRPANNIIATALMLLILLFISSCGEVITVEEKDDAGGGGTSYRLMLHWVAPTTNEDGSLLRDLTGYKVYYGTSPRNYSRVVTLGNENSAEIGEMGPGTWYVAITAFDRYGNESDYSNEINYTFN